MARDGRCERRAAAGEAGAADFPDHASVIAATDGASKGSGSGCVCRAGFAGRGTTFALPTERHTLGSSPDPRQGLGSH